jgi:hypothetical protein
MAHLGKWKIQITEDSYPHDTIGAGKALRRFCDAFLWHQERSDGHKFWDML